MESVFLLHGAAICIAAKRVQMSHAPCSFSPEGLQSNPRLPPRRCLSDYTFAPFGFFLLLSLRASGLLTVSCCFPGLRQGQCVVILMEAISVTVMFQRDIAPQKANVPGWVPLLFPPD